MKTTEARSRIACMAALGAAAAGAGLLAGCGSPSPASAVPQPPAVTSSLATSVTTAGGTAWAIVPMGGPAAQQDNFWELFALPAASTQWQLVTPPGVATNGGMVAANPGTGQGLGVAFRPSQGLTFSPLALTGDAGRTWRTGVLDAPIAAAPDALAFDGRSMLALLDDGAIDQATTHSASWTALAAPGAIGASGAGRRCGVTGLTAITITLSGTPLAAASCARPGVVGIFARTAGSWQAAGPTLTGRSAQMPVQVLRLTESPTGSIALLRVGSGSSASLLAAWSGGGSHWTVSQPSPADGSGQVRASGTGATGTVWVLLANGSAAAVSGPGTPWRVLPKPPAGTAALAAGPGSTFDALAASGKQLTVFQLSAAGTWRQTQVMSVPIEYGSSS